MNKKKLLDKVANLTDNINKKVRKFRKENLSNFYENKLNYVTAKYDKKINLTMDSGYLTKSKRELDKLSLKELEGLYNNLHSLQTNKDFGTVKRFRIYETKQLSKTANTLKELIGEEKFNELKGVKSEVDLVKEFISRKKEMSDARGGTYVSNQILNEMYLEVPNIDEEEMQDSLRAIKKMERAREMMNRNNIQMEGRKRNGNR